MTIKVAIADDQAMVRMGFTLLLQEVEGVEIVAECADGQEALEAVEKHSPDVMLLDIRMPKVDGLTVARRVSDRVKVVIVTTFGDDDYVDNAIANGAVGFLLKDSGSDLVIKAVHAAARGDAMISPELTLPLLRRGTSRKDAELREAVEGLSEREREVVVCVAQGLTNAEIAEKLDVAVSTIKTHMSNIQGRFLARNRVEVAAKMWQSGMMP